MDFLFFSFLVVFYCLFLFSPSTNACERCLHHSKAAYFPSEADLSGGACGYGSMATQLNGGYIAAGNPALFRRGNGCGGCYKVRCVDKMLCNSEGVKVILTDSSRRVNRTELVLSKKGFMAMAQKGLAHHLMRLKMVHVEYKRIPCEYKNKNLSIRVEEGSRNPKHLTLKFLFQGGQTDIVAVDLAQVGSPIWEYMTQRRGPIWSTSRAPTGPLQLRVVVTGGSSGKWVWAETEVLPAEWEVGKIYDTGVQISDVAKEACLLPCERGSRRE
ncbi:Expansin-like A1 [Ananas comosus]|uniref:Expansin-like A1 n=1 Tax=Ananas comosus TaxID=4615 RepID=A0A199V1K9_ANACO|nr:Expansin-like A1 [Ananas comosus]